MMRRVALLGMAWLIVSVTAMAASVNLCDYVSPETNLTDLGLSFSYRYFDDGATAGVDESGGRAALAFSQLYDSPDIGFTLAGNGEVLVTGLLPTSGLGDVAGTFRYYLTQDAPLFAFGGLEAAVATGQPQPGIDLSVGAGYGRFSDVTPLAKASTIDKELRRRRHHGIARRSPSEDRETIGRGEPPPSGPRSGCRQHHPDRDHHPLKARQVFGRGCHPGHRRRAQPAGPYRPDWGTSS
jgi:hypothetical protein